MLARSGAGCGVWPAAMAAQSPRRARVRMGFRITPRRGTLARSGTSSRVNGRNGLNTTWGDTVDGMPDESGMGGPGGPPHLGLCKGELDAPETLDQREGFGGEAGGEEAAAGVVAGFVFWVALEVALEGARGSFGLVDDGDTAGERVGKEVGDQRIVGAAEDHAVGHVAGFLQ